MAKVNNFLTERLKKAQEKLSKMTHLAELSSSGGLSSFSGVFKVQKLSDQEQNHLRNILHDFGEENYEIESDLSELMAITSEVKAISNQAAILHGERIKKAQSILKNYKDGAFSAWLMITYGNRQTPYNFLQYYELQLALPHLLHEKLDSMPRQVVYALAAREGDLKLKQDIINSYEGQSKQELLAVIRKTFPLSIRDKRAQNLKAVTVASLRRIRHSLEAAGFSPSDEDKKEIIKELKEFMRFISEKN